MVAAGSASAAGSKHARERFAHLVVAPLVAKRPGHTAAARVEFDDLQPGHPVKGRQGAGGAEHCLLLAVAVNRRRGR